MPMEATEQRQHESSIGEGDNMNADVHPNMNGNMKVNANVNANVNMSPDG